MWLFIIAESIPNINPIASTYSPVLIISLFLIREIFVYFREKEKSTNPQNGVCAINKSCSENFRDIKKDLKDQGDLLGKTRESLEYLRATIDSQNKGD